MKRLAGTCDFFPRLYSYFLCGLRRLRLPIGSLYCILQRNQYNTDLSKAEASYAANQAINPKDQNQKAIPRSDDTSRKAPTIYSRSNSRSIAATNRCAGVRIGAGNVQHRAPGSTAGGASLAIPESRVHPWHRVALRQGSARLFEGSTEWHSSQAASGVESKLRSS